MKSIVVTVLLAAAACGKSADKGAPAVKADATHIPINVTTAGFEPAKVTVQKGVATTLIFTRTADDTCAKSVVIDTGAEKITKDLPLNQPVEIGATFPKAGELQYQCGMSMVSGVITVQ
jgi:plastocyanin domain-containing protein